MKVLVTGFGAYPGVLLNISSGIARDCAALWSRRPGVDVECEILDTIWDTAPAVVRRRANNLQPDILIHLGVSEKATCLVLETTAYNACHAAPDACGEPPIHPTVRNGGKPRIATSAPIAAISGALRTSGVSFVISEDPGRYLCNAVYYEALVAALTVKSHRKCIFIHLPTRFSPETMVRDEAMRGLGVVLDAMLGHPMP